jgi:hypothetical protein
MPCDCPIQQLGTEAKPPLSSAIGSFLSSKSSHDLYEIYNSIAASFETLLKEKETIMS